MTSISSNPISFSKAALGASLAIAYGFITPSSFLGHLGSITLGLAGAGVALVGEAVHKVVQETAAKEAKIEKRHLDIQSKYAPIQKCKAIKVDPTRHHKEFQQAFDKLKVLPAFAHWCAREGHKNRKRRLCDSTKVPCSRNL